MADLVGAVHLPEGSMRAAAGTDVMIDVLAFQRHAEGQPLTGPAWIDLALGSGKTWAFRRLPGVRGG